MSMIRLDHIEHDILRPRFNDPRVHFAINCASKSCPPLLNEPYDGRVIETQLDRQTKRFINNTYFKKDILYISRIFKWFESDFGDNPLVFIKTHASGRLKNALNSSKNRIKIDYLGYDWSLNR